MYLRRLEIQGFKSFADRQRFEFGPGITAVVGPNGSGKSNVADAIRWALGEQSARSLRARKTEDVIFTGSEQRRPVGVAEVTLFLDNTERWMPIDYAEVSVTRRAYRSGENEYLINGQKVRLMDVHDLFRRAQFGQNSYAMMTQGMVDEVLSMRPAERRNLIEEAAGVAQHRVDLLRAERRLAETRDNLGRVRMLLREVEPRIRSLERQSVRAARYRELSRELQETLAVYFEHEARAARDALAAVRMRQEHRAEAFEAATRTVATLDARLAEAAALVATRRTALETAQAEERRRSEEELRLQQEVALAEQRLDLLGGRLREIESELATLVVPEDDGAAQSAALIALDARLAEARTAVERSREALVSADEATRGVLRELAGAEAGRTRVAGSLDEQQHQLTALLGRRERRLRERAEAEAQRAELTERLRDQIAQLRTLRRERSALAARALEARRRREVAERRLEEQQRFVAEARAGIQAAEVDEAQLRARRDLLADVTETVPDGTAAARALLAAARAGHGVEEGEPLAGIVNVVSRLIEVPEGLESAIEAALAEQLSAVVVEDREGALAAIEYLQQQGAGATTIYPLDAVPHHYPLNLFNERGVIGVAARLVRTDHHYRPLIDTLLGRTIVVDHLDTARRMIERGLGSVVTRDGVLLRPGGAVFGGRGGGGAEQFALRRELHELPERIATAEQEVQRARDRLARAEAGLADARDAVEEARRGVDPAEERRRGLEERGARLRGQLATLLGQLRMLRAILADQEADAEAPISETRDRLAALAAERDTIERAIIVLRDRSEAIGSERDLAADRVADATRALATAEGERTLLLEQREERAAQRRRLIERIEERRTQAATIRGEREGIESGLIDQRARLAEARTALQQAREQVGPAHDGLAHAQQAERECATARGDAQAELFAAERQLLEAETALRECTARLQHLHEQLADESLQLTEDGRIIPIPADGAGEPRGVGDESGSDERQVTPANTVDAPRAATTLVAPPIGGGAELDPVELRDRVSELRRLIRNLGPVNIDAVDELAEERERFQFLSTQVTDLEAAEQQLREAILDLERLIRTSFDATFDQVAERFQEFFVRFFGGGSARLSIVEPEEGDEAAGVEIFASPPGKKVQTLAQLSGGERSLTSVALLFALLTVNPAPICVLDEVDAALDEANVGRFADSLRALCDRSQFVMITHNRRSVEVAHAIYGVSMGEASTSQVLSLRLADVPQAS